MSTDLTEAVQYAYDDFTISQVAKGMGKADDGELYANRSRGFELVWNADTIIRDDNSMDIEGIKGFMQVSRVSFIILRLTQEFHACVAEICERIVYIHGSTALHRA